jgi:pyruvate/2-oxoglutarate dehydrogenase complex dihydrolipoamide acyltransferase (E2) component
VAKSNPSRKSSSSRGRSASQKADEYRFAQNVEGQLTAAEREYRSYATADSGMTEEPDVLLDVPVVKVDKIHLELEELDAHVALKAKVLDLVNLTVGVDAHLGKLRVDIEGVEAQALVKVRLDHVAAIVDRVLTTIDRNPELVQSLGRTVEQVGSGAGRTLEGTGGAVENIGEGAGGAVENVGQGAGRAVGQIGEGAGQAVGQVGQAAGQAVGGLGQGPGQAAKVIAKEIGSAASDEAKDLGLAATRKVKELGARRRHRRADRHHATEAAIRRADEHGLELDEIEGTGAEGRVTVRDVQRVLQGGG